MGDISGLVSGGVSTVGDISGLVSGWCPLWVISLVWSVGGVHCG